MIKRYLVIETAYLGDVIISLAVARAIKQCEPESHVTFLVRPDAVEIAAASPDVDNVISFDKRGRESGSAGIAAKAAELNRLQLDVVIALHSSQRTARLVQQLQGPVRVGWSALGNMLTASVPDEGWCNRYERVLLPLTLIFGPDTPRDVLPRIISKPLPVVDDFVANASRVFSIAPGSAWQTKQWALDRYKEVALRLLESGSRVIVIGGASEKDFGAELEKLGSSVLNLAGRASLLESAYAISRSDLLIGNDSSPVHLATAVGTRSVVIYGPTVPEFGFLPPGGLGHSVEQPLWCRPCTSHGSRECPTHTHDCMNLVTVDQVLEAALQNARRETLSEPF